MAKPIDKAKEAKLVLSLWKENKGKEAIGSTVSEDAHTTLMQRRWGDLGFTPWLN